MEFHTRTETIILIILELLGLFFAIHGLWFQYIKLASITGIFYCSVWYILDTFAHFLGLLSIFLEMTEDALKGNSQTYLQYHYLTAWLAVVVGYPLIVTYTWMMYYPSILAQVNLALAIIPIVAWIGQSGHGIVRTTQFCTGLAAMSHGFICYLADDAWGVATSFVMAVNIIALSLPTKYHIWEFNSRELFIIGLVICSMLMEKSIVAMNAPVLVQSLNILAKSLQ